MKGKDTFISLPTGYGKSLCYIMLPKLFDKLRGSKRSIVLVVSPLLSLMKDQVASIEAKGIAAVDVSDKERMGSGKQGGLCSGDYQIIFVSPESLFQGTEMRKLLCTDICRENLVAYVIDEAHCVLKWYVFIIELPYIFAIILFIHSFIHYLFIL